MCSGNGSPCSGIVINCCGGGAPQNPPCAGIGFVVNGIDRALGEMVTTADMGINGSDSFLVGIKNPGAAPLVVSNIQFVNGMPPGAPTSGVVYSTSAVFPLTIPAGSSTQFLVTLTSGGATGLTSVLMSVASNACGANNAILGFTTQVNNPVLPCETLLVEVDTTGTGTSYAPWSLAGMVGMGVVEHGGSRTVRVRVTNPSSNTATQQLTQMFVNGDFDPTPPAPIVTVAPVVGVFPVSLLVGQSQEFDLTFDVSQITLSGAIGWQLWNVGNFAIAHNGCLLTLDLELEKAPELLCSDLEVQFCDVSGDGCWVAPFTAEGMCYLPGDYNGMVWNLNEQGDWKVRITNTRAYRNVQFVVSATVQNNVLLNAPAFGVIQTLAPGQSIELPFSVISTALGDFAVTVSVSMIGLPSCLQEFICSGVTVQPCQQAAYLIYLDGSVTANWIADGGVFNVPDVSQLGTYRVVLDLINNNACQNISLQSLTATVVQNNLGTVDVVPGSWLVTPPSSPSQYLDFTAGTVTGAYTIEVDLVWVGGCTARLYIQGNVI